MEFVCVFLFYFFGLEVREVRDLRAEEGSLIPVESQSLKNPEEDYSEVRTRVSCRAFYIPSLQDRSFYLGGGGSFTHKTTKPVTVETVNLAQTEHPKSKLSQLE